MALKTMIASIVTKTMTKKLKNATIQEEDIKEILKEIRISLLDADVNLLVVKKFIKNIKEKAIGLIVDPKQKPGDVLLTIIKDELVSILGKEMTPMNINKKPLKIMMVGLQGSGKTTTTAKIANYYKSRNQKAPLLVACDIYRPAAIDQLKTLAEQTRTEFFEKGTQDPAKTAKQALEKANKEGLDIVLFDTAGRLQTDAKLMQELRAIKSSVKPDEIILVVDAMAGQDIINVAREFNETLKLTGIIITKLDSDARAGAALSITSMIDVPIKFTGVGEKIGSLDLFYPERMADRILGLGDVMSLAEKAADVIDEKQAKNQLQRMLSGKMDLEDLMQQLNQVSKMGSLGGIMGMLPGQNKKMSEEKLFEIENKMKVWNILMTSMTKKERRNPKLFKKQPNRKARVVKGSGRKPDELNKLLKQWEDGKTKMAQMGQMMKKGNNPFSGSGGFNF